MIVYLLFFFFSSRRRHTRWTGDWSSDVCSSDLEEAAALAMTAASELRGTHQVDAGRSYVLLGEIFAGIGDEERAQELLELAIELLEREGPSGYLVQAYKRLAAICRKRGDTEGALDVLERAL